MRTKKFLFATTFLMMAACMMRDILLILPLRWVGRIAKSPTPPLQFLTCSLSVIRLPRLGVSTSTISRASLCR